MKEGRKRKSVKNAVLRFLFLAFLGITLGINFYNWNAGNLVGNQMPMPFGYGVSIVLSGSMEPAISVNDLVIVKETKEIEVGDVIVYQSGRDLIIHRVISKNGDLIVTQGDANQVADVPITMADVKGKMIGSIPAVGMAVKCLKSPLVMIGLLLIAFYMMEHSFRLDREQDEEEMQELRDEIAYLKQKKKLQTYRHHRKNRED